MEKGITWLVAGILIIVAAAGGWWLGGSKASSLSSSQTASNTQNNSTKAEQLSAAMNKLWEDHITWTRLYLISAVNKLPDKDATLARLMKNQEDLGSAIKDYYGDEAANKLTQLLKDHITGADKVVQAAVKNDTAAVISANTAWHDNGMQIADFLANANPNWPQDDMRKMVDDHLTATFQEAKDIIAKKSADSVADYDKVHEQILQMSEMISSGIIKQFPDKF